MDIRALRDARGDGPPSELQARREKYAFFEKHCSEVAEGLFLGSDVVARNRDTLRAAGVTHVINCVGFLYPAYFKDELTYLTLYLQGDAWSVEAQPPCSEKPAPGLCATTLMLLRACM